MSTVINQKKQINTKFERAKTKLMNNLRLHVRKKCHNNMSFCGDH